MCYINKTRFFILTTILTLTFSFLYSYAKDVNQDLADSVLRLHILANSDSDYDQNLKLAVRDRIIKDASYIFNNTKSPGDALNLAKSNINVLKSIAEDEVKKQGFTYDVNISIGSFPFPTKTYDEIMLPAGKYRAVRIEIGSGKGQNWWCVMYPPLCFTDGVLSASESTKQKLKDSLSKSDYNLIVGKSDNCIPVEVKFKVVELFQSIF